MTAEGNLSLLVWRSSLFVLREDGDKQIMCYDVDRCDMKWLFYANQLSRRVDKREKGRSSAPIISKMPGFPYPTKSDAGVTE